MKKFFGVFTVGLLCAVSTSPLYAMLDPEIIQVKEERGIGILPQQTTGAASLHKEGFEGEGVKVAIIDQAFYAKYSQRLDHLIDPIAYSENLIFNYDDVECGLNTLFVRKQRAQASLNTEENSEKREILENKIKLLEKRISIKQKHDFIFEKERKAHGSMVMACVPLIARKARLFPIDLDRLDTLPDYYSRISYAIREAIKHKANIISMSFNPAFNVTDELVEACKEARLKNIPIIFSAGNDSLENIPLFTNEKLIKKDVKTSFISKSMVGELYDRLDGQGIWFAGALE